jgi:sulfite exporter TauE/SafE
MEIFSGFVIGLVGSMHCIGMCGPIVLALPANKSGGFNFYSGRLLYNLGRVLTYSLFGLIFGVIGSGFFIAGFQRWLSIIPGIIIILLVVIPSGTKNKIINSFNFSSGIKHLFGKLINSNSLFTLFIIGILNGFLPCGFVYAGLAGALVLGDIWQSTLFMFFFGLGTIPLMYSASVAGGFINSKVKLKFRKIIPVLAVVFGLILILRGLNLGIPYISPKMDKTQSQMKDCCN